MSYIYPSLENQKTRYKVYYVCQQKKIYLGLYDTEQEAKNALEEAANVMNQSIPIEEYACQYLNFNKYVTLCNFRDRRVYIKNPIYTYDTYFDYYLSQDLILTFDMKDLFFFSSYKIRKRGNYIYIQDSVTQQSILSRFGIHPHSTYGIDYKFKNGNSYDFRRENIEIINSYKGVIYKEKNGTLVYVAKIFIDHDIVIGHYATQTEAAVAYNKAADILEKRGIKKEFIRNTIPYLTLTEYNEIYDRLMVSPALKAPSKQKRIVSSKEYRGTCKDKSGFRASIGYKGKQIYLGIYPTEKRAAQAYNFASFYLYGSSGYVNDVTPLIYEGDSAQIAKQFLKYNITK